MRYWHTDPAHERNTCTPAQNDDWWWGVTPTLTMGLCSHLESSGKQINQQHTAVHIFWGPIAAQRRCSVLRAGSSWPSTTAARHLVRSWVDRLKKKTTTENPPVSHGLLRAQFYRASNSHALHLEFLEAEDTRHVLTCRFPRPLLPPPLPWTRPSTATLAPSKREAVRLPWSPWCRIRSKTGPAHSSASAAKSAVHRRNGRKRHAQAEVFNGDNFETMGRWISDTSW